MPRSTAALALVTVFLASCGEQASESSTDFAAREGVLREITRIDGYREELVPIGSAALRPDGVIAFNQVQDGRLLLFNDDGSPAGSIGRRGEGPGEFMNPYRFGWSGDTLWVYDGILRRITRIGPDLQVTSVDGGIPQAALPRNEDRAKLPEFPFAFPIALLPDGSLLASLGFAVGQAVPEPFAGRSVIGRMDVNGAVEGITMLLPPAEAASVVSGGGSAGLPFGNLPQTAVAPDRRSVAVAMAALSGDQAGTFHLAVVGLSGDTLLSRRFPFEPEPIPPAVADSALDAVVNRVQGLFPSLADAVRRDGIVPPVYPPITNLLIGNDQTYWIGLRDTDDARPYYVVSSSGAALGTVHLPRRSQVAAAEGDRLWVIERDDLDVQHLVRYELLWE